ncbi:AAA family ATPase [Algoriphagus sp. PAP.12]|uniref:AAA family ATPase n=1 Tax=Algoriphagus sp. PAP.12 TaxID=2996678 RepID=UPI00227C380F|nr:ATP-binding protein [Algoriphagus sp. PAP.12]
MKNPSNPFVITGYNGKKFFCNREKELSQLKSHIENERNIVLYAWRRLGKSALIHRLFEDLSKSNDYETIYVDLLATQNMEEAIQAISAAVFEKYGRTKNGINQSIQNLLASIGATLKFNSLTGLPEIALKINQPEKVKDSLISLSDFLRTRKKRVIIAIDEFQQISTFENEKGEAVFRTWIQQIPDIRFIFSGSHRGMMEAMFMETKRPFYQSAVLESLRPIELKSYTEFIQHFFTEADKTIDADSIQLIYSWSRGQTFTIQLTCNRLYGDYQSVDESKAQEVFEEILEQQKAVFSNFQRILTRTQWTVLKAVAKEEPLINPFSKEFIQNHNLGAVSSVRTALKALEKSELIIKDEDRYLVHDVQLARWLGSL